MRTYFPVRGRNGGRRVNRGRGEKQGLGWLLPDHQGPKVHSLQEEKRVKIFKKRNLSPGVRGFHINYSVWGEIYIA